MKQLEAFEKDDGPAHRSGDFHIAQIRQKLCAVVKSADDLWRDIHDHTAYCNFVCKYFTMKFGID